ncbi:hypothetical protein ACJJIK_10585 [Microbulbifer sp. ZKSA006]|uniref:hypothetical protein n=1 Tax=Microbulbifer sp. ZKSA006 TaxID=3243390 RepID=UPI00403A2CB0
MLVRFYEDRIDELPDDVAKFYLSRMGIEFLAEMTVQEINTLISGSMTGNTLEEAIEEARREMVELSDEEDRLTDEALKRYAKEMTIENIGMVKFKDMF